MDLENLEPGAKGRRVRARTRLAGLPLAEHTAASLWFERDANPVQVAKLLGHAKASVTLSICAHYIRRELLLALDLAAELRRRRRSLRAPPMRDSLPSTSPVAT